MAPVYIAGNFHGQVSFSVLNGFAFRGNHPAGGFPSPAPSFGAAGKSAGPGDLHGQPDPVVGRPVNSRSQHNGHLGYFLTAPAAFQETG